MKKAIGITLALMFAIASAFAVYRNSGSVADGNIKELFEQSIRQLSGSTLKAPTGKEQAVPARSATPLKANEAVALPTIYGVVYSSSDYELKKGIYSFCPDASALNFNKVFELPQELEYMLYSGGGCYNANGKYYVISNDSQKLYTFDTSVWEQLKAVPVKYSTTDMTFDIATQTIYCCYYEIGKQLNGPFYFGKINPETGAFTQIRKLEDLFNGIAADNKGQIFAIARDSKLYKVDKETGALTSVGATGVTIPTKNANQASSATFDLATGNLYWFYNHRDDETWKTTPNLYKVNTETGECTQLDTPSGSLFSGIYIPYDVTSEEAPAHIEDLEATFENGGTEGVVTFTLPSTTVSGNALVGIVNYQISIAGANVGSGSASAGEKVSKPVSANASGDVKLAVTLYAGSASGNSSVTEKQIWLGKDTPLAVTNLALTGNGNNVSLTWDAPASKGVHGGYVEPSQVTYKIILQPGNQIRAEAHASTTFTDQIESDSYANIYYEVIPSFGGNAGEAAVSNKTPMGPAFETPYKENFDDAAGFELFSIVDVADDGATWAYYKEENEAYAYCNYHFDPMSSANNKPKDDWLISPPIRLENGTRYIMSFSASSLMLTMPERLEVKLGKGLDPANFTKTVFEPTIIENAQSWTWHTYTVEIEVEETADYRFGFHAMSDAGMFKLGLDDIRIDGSLLTAPLPASELSAEPAPMGAHRATVSFVTPTQTVAGNALGALSKVEIYCQNEKVKTVENPALGVKLSEEITTVDGLNKIDVVCYNNNDERSFAASTKVFTGADAPGMTKNVKALVVEDGKVELTWEAPDGKNGGYVDPENLSYYVVRYLSANEQVSLAYDYEGNSFTDEYEADAQTVFTYLVIAMNEKGFGSSGVSNPIVVGGESYTLPFVESFANGYSNYGIWNNVSCNGGLGNWYLWSPSDNVLPYDNDKGCVAFTPNKAGDETYLFSGKIDISKAANPLFQFCYYHDGSSNVLKAQVNPATKGWVDEKVIDLSDKSIPEGWTKVTIPLEKYKDEPYVQIAFYGIANEMSKIYVDNIRIRDVFENDLSVSLQSRTRFKPGEQYKLTAKVTNVGEKDATAFKVNFYRDDELLESVGASPLQYDESKDYSIVTSIDLGAEDTAVYRAVVEYGDDNNLENNESSVEVTSVLPKYPAPTGLIGEEEGGVAYLRWEAPQEPVRETPVPVTDDFESYEPFIIEDIGEWTVVDENGSAGTFGLLGCNFPHREEAKSFQVFNIWALFNNLTENDTEWMANSGEQMLVSFADLDRKSDDWLISPELTGEAQTIKFFAKSVNYIYPNETYEVLVSDTDMELGSFRKIKEGDVSIDWVEISVDLPEGSKYFAIKCTSPDLFAMAVDDITYTPGTGIPDDLELVGYNVYKDGVKINTETVTATEFRNPMDDQADHTYAVSAVYNYGESRHSGKYTFFRSGSVTGVEATQPVIKSGQRQIIVSNAAGLPLLVCNMDGQVLYNAMGSDKNVIGVSQGIYLVKAGDTVAKVVVK